MNNTKHSQKIESFKILYLKIDLFMYLLILFIYKLLKKLMKSNKEMKLFLEKNIFLKI